MPTVIAEPTAGRIRIAISSPEIVARIRHEFARKGLDVRIDGPPAVDVVIAASPGTVPATRALADALNGLAGPHTHQRDPATARYRLALVPHGRSARVRPRDHPALSPREAQVMEAISRGMRNADIAALLQVREKTVKNHVNRIFTKLGVRNRVEAVLTWQQGRPAQVEPPASSRLR